jgi:fimbrial isopeptide formation D2 family protein/LPXTG-motif cell wall-anchored protein
MKALHNKRVLGIILAALLLLMTFAPAVSAAPPTGTITINAPSGKTLGNEDISIYRVFDLTWDGASAYTYTLNSSFASLLPLTVGSNTYTTLAALLTALNSESVAREFAEAVRVWIGTNSPTVVETKVAATVAGEGSVTFSNLPYGYYIVVGGAVTDGDGNEALAAVALTTTDVNAVITLKADVPGIDKQVRDDDASPWGVVTDASIGDTVQFKLTSAVPDMTGYTSYTYIIHDTLSAGLTYDDTSLVVKIDDATLTKDSTNDYTVTHSSGALTITFSNFILRESQAGKAIVVTYTAKLNADAVVGQSGGNPNKVCLEYSNDPYDSGSTDTTPEAEVRVWTYELDVYKHTGVYDPGPSIPLPGAKFSLYKDTNGNGTYDVGTDTIVKFDDAVKEGTPEQRNYRVNEDNGTETVLVTPTAAESSSDRIGKIYLLGLDAGTYFLVETEAPAGYNLLEDPIKVEIVATYGAPGGYTNATLTYAVNGGTPNGGNNPVAVQNNAGGKLPETGGIGTTIFTVGGGALMLAAVVVLVARRKAKHNS